MRDVDLLAGLGAMAYAIAAGVLASLGIVDLGEFVAQPQAAGAFGVIALGRWYTRNRKGRQDDGNE